jgi:prepilin-type N-terminal cleavage/methylation domain-containing protein
MKKRWSTLSGRWSDGAVANAEQPLATDSRRPPLSLTIDHRPPTASSRGFTLIELVITLTVLTILTLGVIPLVKVSVKRQREQRLRDTLREVRAAIDQFHREALAGVQIRTGGTGGGDGSGGGGGGGGGGGAGTPPPVDPRIRVAITDNTIFGTENPDRYPPDLETLVNGVNVTPLAGAGAGGGGIVGLSGSDRTLTDNTVTSTKKKIYLRQIPIDPMTGESDWELRSTYDSKDAASWGRENVFDIRSKSTETALDGSKYSDW